MHSSCSDANLKKQGESPYGHLDFHRLLKTQAPGRAGPSVSVRPVGLRRGHPTPPVPHGPFLALLPHVPSLPSPEVVEYETPGPSVPT